jgi:hypothetical protein
VHRDPALPIVTAGEYSLPIKEQESSPLIQGRKEVICTTIRTLRGAIFPAYPSLRKSAGALEEKTQNPTTGAQGFKTLTKNNSR